MHRILFVLLLFPGLFSTAEGIDARIAKRAEQASKAPVTQAAQIPDDHQHNDGTRHTHRHEGHHSHGDGRHAHNHGDDLPSILLLAVTPSEPAKANMLAEVALQHGVRLQPMFLSDQDPESVIEKMRQYDMVMLDYIFEGQLKRMTGQYRGALMSYQGILFPGLYYQQEEMVRGLTKTQAKTLFDYFDSGGRQNFERMFGYLKHEIFKVSTAEPESPIIFPEAGIYHPDAEEKIFTGLDDLLAWRHPSPERPVIGLGIHRVRLSDDMTLAMDDLIHRLEKAGAFVYAYFHETDKPAIDLLYHDDKPLVDAIITMRGVMNSPSMRSKELQQLNVAAINALNWRGGPADEFYADDGGYPFYAMSVFMILPEIAGYIDANVVVAQRQRDQQHIAIPEQMDALMKRTMKYVKLRKMANEDKKVAIMFWSSPP